MDVKSWQERLPEVGEVRPGCAVCRAPGVELSGRVVVHGNGTRARWQWGPGALGELPTRLRVRLRRYECQDCGAVLMVGPRGIVVGYLYSAMAIGLALLLWGALGRQDAEVRAAVGVAREEGVSRPERWPTARRWARAGATGRLWASIEPGERGPVREMAERVARILCARAGPGESEAERIWSASEHAR